MSADAELHRRREALVLRHVEAENDRDLEAIMATFARPRYEIVPTATVYDGDAAVRQQPRDGVLPALQVTQGDEAPGADGGDEESLPPDAVPMLPVLA